MKKATKPISIISSVAFDVLTLHPCNYLYNYYQVPIFYYYNVISTTLVVLLLLHPGLKLLVGALYIVTTAYKVLCTLVVIYSRCLVVVGL